MKIKNKEFVYTLLLFVGVMLLLFYKLLNPSNILMTTDDNIGHLALFKSWLPHGFLGTWNDSVLVGMNELVNFTWTRILLWLMPLKFFTNWIHGVDLFLASVFLVLFLRKREVGWIGCCIGALTAFWLGSNFTLTYAGHIGKFGVLMFAALALWLTEEAVQRRSVAWALLAGASLGSMFLEQADVALFFFIIWIPYAVYAVIRTYGFKMNILATLLIPIGIIAALLAFRAVWTGYFTSVKGITSVSDEDPRAKWEFTTQWSWPPEETIDFIAPGYMGWRSGESAGPYWGRMGRSAGWETAKQGFQNFKLENHYLGAIPVVFMLWACFVALVGRRKEGKQKWDVIFWLSAFVLTMLLSFGKYFPLYKLFYLLPGVSSIRNPNKFLHIVQIAIGILSAYGIHFVFASDKHQRVEAPDRKLIKNGIKVLVAIAGLFVLWSLLVYALWNSNVQSLTAIWPAQMAEAIVKTKVAALFHAVVMLIIAIGMIIYAYRCRSNGKIINRFVPLALIVLMVADAAWLSRHYVKTMPASLIKENDVVRVLKANMGYERIALVSQDSFYNAWLTYLFPYHHIRTINYTQMPRMPEDYQAFLDTVRRHTIRMWQLTSAGFIMGPSQVWGQIQNDPNLKDYFELIYAFNVVPDGKGGVEVIPASETQPGQHCILKMNPLPKRYMLASQWASLSASETLNKLIAPDFVPMREVLLGEDAPPMDDVSTDAVSVASSFVTVKEFHPGKVVLSSSVASPCILRIAEWYNANWHATINDKPVDIFRCDYLFQGVKVPAGLNEITLRYQQSPWTFYVQLVGVMISIGAIVRCLYVRKQGVEKGKEC